MQRVQFIQHKGKQLLQLDFSSSKPDEVLAIMKEAKGVIAAQPPASIRIITDVTDAGFNSAVSDAMKEFVTHNKPYVTASAVVGITGLKQIIFNAVLKFSGRNLVAFDTLAKAKDWLAEQ